MRSAIEQELLNINFDHLGVMKTAEACVVERRIVEFFKRQVDTLPKNDCTAGYLSGELMAWGLVKAISEDTEMELGSLFAKQWRKVLESA